MAIGNINPGAPVGQSQPQLESGVSQAVRYGAGGGSNGFDYYYNGTKYSDPTQANSAAQADRQRQISAASNGHVTTGSNIAEATPMPTASPGSTSGAAGVGMPPSVMALGGYDAGPSAAPAGNPAGPYVNYNNGALPVDSGAAGADQLKQGDMAYAAQLQAQAEARRISELNSINGMNGGANVDASSINHNEEAARNAAFARAKEQSGQTALASLQALQDVMGSTGRAGSSQEGMGISDIVNGAQHGVNDITDEQLITDLNRSSDIADRQYQGAVTMRGQDKSMIPSIMSLIGGSSTGGIY